MDNRRWMFALAALLMAGGMVGCSDDDSSSGGGGIAKPPVLCDGVKCVDGQCVDGVCNKTCADFPQECGTEERDCSDADVCKSDASCPGKDASCKACSFENNNCSWDSCKNASGCKGEPGEKYCHGEPEVCECYGPTKAACNTSIPTEDADCDGIPNGIENKGGSDPCLADTDGDTVPDGDEDLNHDGVIDTAHGETDPKDPNSKPSEAELAVTKIACSSAILEGGAEVAMDLFTVAVPKAIGGTAALTGYKKSENTAEGTDVVTMDDKGVVMAFGARQDPRSAAELMLDVHEQTGIIADGGIGKMSDFKSSIPLASWSENGYDHNLQIIPDHEVSRYVYNITLNDGVTLEQFRDALAAQINAGMEVEAGIGATDCTVEGENIVSVYLARSHYSDDSTDLYVYSAAVACKKDVDNESIRSRMSDVYSGTLVAPKNIDGNNYGYLAYKDFMCQKESFGDASAQVDFIWVIDNSGSMADEQENLTKTASAFMEKLAKAKIDFRLGVATTDSYLLDESSDTYAASDSGSSDYYMFDDEAVPKGKSTYFSYVGLITPGSNMSRCMMNQGSSNKFATLVSRKAGCIKDKDTNKNICGKGFEDGFKSLQVVLERLNIDASAPYDELEPEAKKKANFVFNNTQDVLEKQCKDGITGESANPCGQGVNCCEAYYSSCAPRKDALTYVIWVSDEESRQFKEPVSGDAEALISNSKENLVGCLTGYKLEHGDGYVDGSTNLSELVYNMATGAWKDGINTVADCNPSMRAKVLDLIDKGELTMNSSLEDIHQKAPEYYDMLMYYIKSFRDLTNGNIAAFALVGDEGIERGGKCKELGNTADAKEGANYGLSYIHAARFLSALTADGKNDGKEGGSGSICNTDYQATVDEIFNDVSGRLSNHILKGYPISSTIVVAVHTAGGAKELVRGQDWSYDASQNAITFTGVNASAEDTIAISYVLWKKNQG